jgi:hypothetical protein
MTGAPLHDLTLHPADMVDMPVRQQDQVNRQTAGLDHLPDPRVLLTGVDDGCPPGECTGDHVTICLIERQRAGPDL